MNWISSYCTIEVGSAAGNDLDSLVGQCLTDSVAVVDHQPDVPARIRRLGSGS